MNEIQEMDIFWLLETLHEEEGEELQEKSLFEAFGK